MNFSFGLPLVLLLLLLIPCFIWCKVHTRSYYFPKISWITTYPPLLSVRLWLKIILFSLMITALADPFFYHDAASHNKRGRDLALVLDASGSMAQSGFHLSDRFKTRFEASSELAKDFVKKRLNDNISVVVFGSFAYTASPLTYDLNGVRFLIDMTNVGIAGESTAIGDALMQALHSLSFGEAKSKVIILLTDGHHNAGKRSPKEAVRQAVKAGVKIYTIGIGKPSEYDAGLLQTIARKTGGESYAATTKEELSKVYSKIESLEPSAIRSENYLRHTSLASYPIGLALLILLGWIITGRHEKR